MPTQLTIQAPALQITPTANAADATGNYIIPGVANVRYVTLRFANTGGAPVTVTLDDPTSVTPVSAKQFNPDVDLVVPNAAVREQVVDTYRFVDPATGRVNWTYSAALTGSVEVIGVV